MAVEWKLDKTEMSRGSSYRIDPRRIRINPEFNGRHVLPPIDDLVEDFLANGQSTPCAVGNDGGVPVLRFGHRRYRAAMQLTQSHPLEGLGYWPLWVVNYAGSAWDAFLAAVSENHQREQSVPIDDAHNIALMERRGMPVEAIAKHYFPTAAKDPDKLKSAIAWVRQRLSLLSLSDVGVQALNEGRMKPSAAAALAKLSADAQAERLKKLADAKRITTADINGNSAGAAQKRKISDLRVFWKPYAELEQESPIVTFARAQQAYLDGGDPEVFFATVKRLLGVK